MGKHQKGNASAMDVVGHLSRWDKIEEETLNQQYIGITKLHLQRWVSKTLYQKEGGWKVLFGIGHKNTSAVELGHSHTSKR